MKTAILILMLLLGLSATAQNGGQFFQNNIIRVDYLGYSNGAHLFKIYNKQSCEARIRTKADQDPAVDVQVPGQNHAYVSIPRSTPANILFRAKAETACVTNPDMGWLEIRTPDYVLPIVDNNYVTVTRGPSKLELSIINDVYKSRYGMLDYLEHITIYDLLGVVKYRSSTFVRKQHQINLNNYLQKGLNFVEVSIQTNKVERFVFRYIK